MRVSSFANTYHQATQQFFTDLENLRGIKGQEQNALKLSLLLELSDYSTSHDKLQRQISLLRLDEHVSVLNIKFLGKLLSRKDKQLIRLLPLIANNLKFQLCLLDNGLCNHEKAIMPGDINTFSFFKQSMNVDESHQLASGCINDLPSLIFTCTHQNGKSYVGAIIKVGAVKEISRIDQDSGTVIDESLKFPIEILSSTYKEFVIEVMDGRLLVAVLDGVLTDTETSNELTVSPNEFKESLVNYHASDNQFFLAIKALIGTLE